MSGDELRWDIRPARPGDARAIAACVTDAYSPWIARVGSPPPPMLADYERVVREHDTFVAEIAGEIAGVLVLVASAERILLDNVAVHPRHQRRGIGNSLLDLAESEARRRGVDAVVLYTNELMTENVARYMRRGYVEFERRFEVGINRIYMRKVVDGSPGR